jgi:hypothetical protein
MHNPPLLIIRESDLVCQRQRTRATGDESETGVSFGSNCPGKACKCEKYPGNVLRLYYKVETVKRNNSGEWGGEEENRDETFFNRKPTGLRDAHRDLSQYLC